MGCESRKPFLSYSDLARILSGLASGKLPDQTQLNQILLALISFLGDVGAESDEVERPALVRCLSELLESIRLLNQARNDHDQIQDLIHQSFYHTSQSDVTISSLLDPSISSQTSDLLKHQARLIHSIFPILLSLLIDRSQSFLIILFNQSIDLIGVTISTTISSDQDGSIDGQEQPTLSDSIEQQTDRFISRLINLVVVVHQRSSQHEYRVIKGFLDKFIQSTSDLIDSSTDQSEKRSNDQQQSPIFEQLTSSLELLVRLTGQDEGADRIRSDFLEIKQFLRDQPENYLSSLREKTFLLVCGFQKQIQMILSDLLMDFDQSIYSPNLYSTLTKPIRTFLRSIRALNPLLEKLLKDLRGFVEDVLSDHLISLFLERLQAFFIQLDGFSLGSGAVGGAKGVSKVLRDDLIDYMVPRIFSLIQEIPLPRIEFISERRLRLSPRILQETFKRSR
ncbi:hypothetical protein BY996DRAFT_1944944 [Phakopsora pachyrhizi]|nr:hypothetical protein BY996DRAFT_1944944 [Phakopsora pachyrhizi]